MASRPVWHVSAGFHWLLRANGSELKNYTCLLLWGLVWRFYVSSPVKIRQSGWPVMLFEGFWYNEKWREIQDGTNDVIGCLELAYIQGFQRYLFCEIWINGYKDMSKNAFMLNIAPPKGQRSLKFMRLFMMVSWVGVISLMSKDQTVAEIWPHVLFGDVATKFDWL